MDLFEIRENGRKLAAQVYDGKGDVLKEAKKCAKYMAMKKLDGWKILNDDIALVYKNTILLSERSNFHSNFYFKIAIFEGVFPKLRKMKNGKKYRRVLKK